MIEIKRDFVKTAERETQMMMDELSEMAKIATAGNLNKIIEVCEVCDVTDNEVHAIIDGDVDNMSVYDYHILKSYFNHMIKSNGYPIEEPSLNKEFEIEIDDEIPENDCSERCGECGVDSCSSCCGCENNDCKNSECTCRKENMSENDDTCDFIDKVNANLPKEYHIDKEDAIKAKKAFDNDINKKVMEDYDKAAKEANIELFGTSRDLNSMTISELKFLLYKNRWDKEFDLNMINHRHTVLSFLYHKLEDKISEKIKNKNNIKQEDIDNINKVKKNYQDKFHTPTFSSNDAINEIMNLLNKYFK